MKETVTCWHQPSGACSFCVREAVAAAEERGRRRGVEELSDARALLVEIRHELLRVDGGSPESIAELPESLRRASTLARLSAAINALDAALAPRDSAPVCDAVLSSDPFREWRCGKPKDHEGPHAGEAPRDSGKEDQR